jgi:diacylglycerol kinase family enzyme
MYHFIVNPSSSSGKGLAVWTKVEAILSQKHIKYRATLLEHPGEAREIAASGTLKGKVILVGGDGTINEFLSGLSSFEGITFGYIPTGSGNDFARGMRLPAAPAEALEKILTSRRRRYINIGTVSADGISRSFAVSSGAGYDAAVCHEADRDQAKELLNRFRAGKLIYFKNALKMLFSMKTFSLRLGESQIIGLQGSAIAAFAPLQHGFCCQGNAGCSLVHPMLRRANQGRNRFLQGIIAQNAAVAH